MKTITAVLAFGVLGSSWSTSFARLYLMAVLLVAVWWLNRRHSYGLGLVFRGAVSSPRAVAARVKLQHMRRLLQLGAPAGASIFVEIGIFALVTTLIATFGKLPLAGHEVALQCASTTFMVPFAISSATSVRVGHAIGRMRIGRAMPADVAAAGYSGIGCGAAVMLVSAAFFLAIPAPIARLFTPDAGVIAAAVPLLLISAGFQFFDGVQINATGAAHATLLLLGRRNAARHLARLPRTPRRGRTMVGTAHRSHRRGLPAALLLAAHDALAAASLPAAIPVSPTRRC